MQAKLPRLETIVLAVAFVVLVLDAGGGPGWSASATSGVLAVRLTHLASSPLYDALASLAALMPWGEVGFRLGVLGALIGAFTLAGVVAAVRALVPRDVAASLVAVALLLIAPPFRDAAAFASPAILAACGAVWAFACAVRFARDRQPRDIVAAIGACALVVGSAPWLGAALVVATAAWIYRSAAPAPREDTGSDKEHPDRKGKKRSDRKATDRSDRKGEARSISRSRELLALSLGALGLFVIALWLDAAGALPGAAGSLAATVASSGRGAAAIVVGAGLVGVGFGALTNLPHARGLGLFVVLAAAHEIVVGSSAPALLALLAIAVAIIPSAIIRATQPALEGTRRHALAVGAGIPLVAIAAALGARFTVDDPGPAPTQLATDLGGALPPGPGVFVATRGIPLVALQYEMTVAGARPDLVLAPPLAPEQADAVVANALRAQRTVGSNAAAFGRLDIHLALPVGRGFQLVAAVPPEAKLSVSGPAHSASEIGHEKAVLLAVEGALYEASNNRLDIAVRALGLESRFGAADLAVLAATLPSPERPQLFSFLPLDDRPAGDWTLDLFGDDIAWVGGIAIPPVPPDAPIARRLHEKWREILLGKTTPDDPAIAALGPTAVAATKALFVEKKPEPKP